MAGSVFISPYHVGTITKVSNNAVAWTQVQPASGAKQVVLRPVTVASSIKIADSVVHNTPDSTNAVAADDATTEETSYLLLNELKVDLNAHFVLAASHKTADATNAVAAVNTDSLAKSVTLVNECYLDLLAHLIQDEVHYEDDVDTPLVGVLATVGAGLASVMLLANIVKVAYEAHRVLTVEVYENVAAGLTFTWPCTSPMWIQLSGSGDVSVRTHA